jgi:hypothetical protein
MSGSGGSYYAGQAVALHQRNNLVIGSVAANTTTELAVTGLTGVVSGDVGYCVPLAAPVVGFNLTYFRGTGNDAGVIGVQNVSEGALDPADTMDVLIVVNKKTKIVTTV